MTEQCLLSFHIRNFHEHVLCDVVKMEACQILFGRPWLLDRKHHHDGGANTSEFKNDGKWYKLTPIIENTVEKKKICGETSTSSNKIMLCLAKEVLQEDIKGYFYLYLIPKEVKDEVK